MTKDLETVPPISPESVAIATNTIVWQLLKLLDEEGIIDRPKIDRLLEDSAKLNRQSRGPTNEGAASLIDALREDFRK